MVVILADEPAAQLPKLLRAAKLDGLPGRIGVDRGLVPTTALNMPKAE